MEHRTFWTPTKMHALLPIEHDAGPLIRGLIHSAGSADSPGRRHSLRYAAPSADLLATWKLQVSCRRGQAYLQMFEFHTSGHGQTGGLSLIWHYRAREDSDWNERLSVLWGLQGRKKTREIGR